MHNTRHEVRTRSTLIYKVYYLYPPLGYCYKRIPVPGDLCHRLTELTKPPGKGTGFLQIFQNFRIQVRKSYRSSRTSGYGYGSLTEVTQVPGSVARA